MPYLLHAIVRAALTEEARPLALRVPGLPKEFSDLVQRLLEKDPEQRHASASELLRAIDALRVSEGSVQPGKSRSAALVAFVVVVLALIAFGAQQLLGPAGTGAGSF